MSIVYCECWKYPIVGDNRGADTPGPFPSVRRSYLTRQNRGQASMMLRRGWSITRPLALAEREPMKTLFRERAHGR